MKKFSAVDLFSGVGGLSQGMHKAGFATKIAFEIDEIASNAYKQNHTSTKLITKDIRLVKITEVKRAMKGQTIHLLAGCPPCQGFSSIRKLNRTRAVRDDRNSLISEYVRFVKALRPYTIMMENVPGLVHYSLFQKAVATLRRIGYSVDFQVVNVKEFGVPQNRKRLVMVGSRLGDIKVADSPNINVTVRETIGKLPKPSLSKDKLHNIFPIHSKDVQERIRLTPKNGGSRKDLPKKYLLKCHQNKNIGFNDIYGRLSWDKQSTTITGGCLNPSKGRFLHPTQHRNISAREASLLQSFPSTYKFPSDIANDKLALLIGNALPPRFSFYQSKNIKNHLQEFLPI